jgi:hypothetical protein
MFPVLVSLENKQGKLLPGMNGQVTMTVQNKPGVLAIPADAVRAMKDLAVSARALGMNPDSAQAKLQAAMAARRASFGQRDSASGAIASGGAQGTGSAGASGNAARGNRRQRNAAGAGQVPATPSGDAPQSVTLGAGVQGRAGGGGGTGRGAGQLVFVKDSTGFTPRMVRLGVTNYDYTEVLGGLKEGEQVALLASANLQQQRTDQQARIRSATAGPLSPGGGAGGAGGARGGGGAPRGP